jgi:hypothetical protein
MDFKAWLVVIALLAVYGLVGEAEYQSLEDMTRARAEVVAGYAGSGYGSVSHD